MKAYHKPKTFYYMKKVIITIRQKIDLTRIIYKITLLKLLITQSLKLNDTKENLIRANTLKLKCF